MVFNGSQWYTTGSFVYGTFHGVSEPTTVQNLTVETRTATSLLTTWDAPIRCVATEYVVNITEVPGSERVISAKETRTTFTGLTAGTLYTVVVITASREQRSTPTEGQFYTSKSTTMSSV